MRNPCFPLAAASIAAIVTLAGCNREPTVITANGPADVQADALAKAKPVQLPPSIVASKSYRCDDNSIVSVDFMSDNKSVLFHPKKTEAVPLTAAEAGKPFEGNGYSVSGTGSTIQLTKPGKGSQSCKA